MAAVTDNVAVAGLVLFVGSQVADQSEHRHSTRTHRRLSCSRDSGLIRLAIVAVVVLLVVSSSSNLKRSEISNIHRD